MNKVSAIVSSYYADQYLAGRLRNLAEQEVPGGLEIIVVAQEGSKEAAIAAVHQVVLITTPDIPTVYAAWNAAIEVAAGEYITNANSDDRHYPGALAKLAAALDENPKYQLAYANADVVKEEVDKTMPSVITSAEMQAAIESAYPQAANMQEAIKTALDNVGYAKKTKIVGRFNWLEGGLVDLYWKGCFLGPMPMWRKSVHNTVGFFDPAYTSAGDYEFWMRMAKAGMLFFKLRNEESLGAHLEKDDALEHRAPVRSTIEAARARARYRQAVENA